MSRQWGMGLGQFVTSRHPCLRPKETRAPANEGLVVKPNGHMVAKVSAAACIEGVGTQGRVERVQHTKARHGLLERHTFVQAAAGMRKRLPSDKQTISQPSAPKIEFLVSPSRLINAPCLLSARLAISCVQAARRSAHCPFPRETAQKAWASDDRAEN